MSNKKIGLELKEKINKKVDVADISKWALDVYLTDIAANNSELDAILSKLIMMSEGPDFELSNKELIAIADILIVADSSIYTRQKFGKELKEKIKNKEDAELIGRWAFHMYYEHMLDIDDDFQDFLTDLGGMSAGPEFVRSYEELDQIADRLIAAENVKLYH
jgi:hypothetical protein